jgi:hypothetical protein
MSRYRPVVPMPDNVNLTPQVYEEQDGNTPNGFVPTNDPHGYIGQPAEDDTPTLTPNTPEVRRYRGRFLEGNKPVGLFSDIAIVVTTP